VGVSQADAAASGKRIALIVGPTQDKYLGGISHSLEATAQASGMTVTTFSSPFDPAPQARQIDDAIAQKFDMLVVQPISQKAIVPQLIRAKAAGVPVSLVVVPLEGASAQDIYLTYAGYDDTALGTLAGEAMVAQLEASGRTKAKVAMA
jgi:ribose transport system substrate-binding protein